MTSITEQVIKAVIDRVQSQVSDISNRIYFEPPQKTTFPYMQFSFTVDDIPLKGIDAQEFKITFNIFTQRTSIGALILGTRISKKLFDAFNEYDLTLDIGNAFLCHWDGLETSFPEEDGRTVQTVTRFRILTTNG